MAKIEPGMEAMLDMYFYETNSLLEQLDEILLRTEQANKFDGEDVKEIFRIMHTIKGSSAMMGFDNLSVLAHKAEDMFFVIRENPDVITDVSFVYDLVFQVSDSYKAQIELIQNNVNGEYEQMDFSELIDKLLKAHDALVGETKGDSPAQAEAIAAGSAPADAAPAQAAAPAAPAASGDNTTTVRVFFEDGCQMENLRAFLLINTIKDACKTLEFTPADVETNHQVHPPRQRGRGAHRYRQRTERTELRDSIPACSGSDTCGRIPQGGASSRAETHRGDGSVSGVCRTCPGQGAVLSGKGEGGCRKGTAGSRRRPEAVPHQRKPGKAGRAS